MNCWKVGIIICLAAASRCAASTDFGYQDLVDPTNGTDVYGAIVNSTRIVLKLDRSRFTENETWPGVDSALVCNSQPN